MQRLNHKNQFVPTTVLTRTGKILFNTDRASGTNNVSTARHNFNSHAVLTNVARKISTVKPFVNEVRPKTIFHKTHLPFRRTFNRTTTSRTKFSNQKVNIAEVKSVSAVGGKCETVVKPLAGYSWRPNRNGWNKVSKYNGGSNSRNCDYLQGDLKNKGIVDSGCSRHMTGNKAYLAEYQDYNGGPVVFGGSKGYITGKGKIKTGKLDFEDVCFVNELQHFNLSSVSQMCDKKNKVLFTDIECLVLSPDFKLPDENQVLPKVPRQNNMYSFNLENIVPSGGLACLIAKTTVDESNKWHRRVLFVQKGRFSMVSLGRDKSLIQSGTMSVCQKLFNYSPVFDSIALISIRLGICIPPLIRHRSSVRLLHLTMAEVCASKAVVKSAVSCRMASKVMAGVSDVDDELDNVVEEEDEEQIRFLGGNSSSGTKKYRGSNSSDGGNIRDGGQKSCPSNSAIRVVILGLECVLKTSNLVPFILDVASFKLRLGFRGKGPHWLFDLDYLTDSMNYLPVRSENQANKHTGPKEANHSIGIQDTIDAENSEMEAESAQDYFVLPIWSSYTSMVKSSEAKNKVFPPSPTTRGHQKEANNAAEALRKKFAQNTEDLLLQAKAARASSTNTVNTASTPVSTASPSSELSFIHLTNTDQDDLEIPYLEDSYDNPNDGIFTNASYDDEGVVADFINLETLVNVSPIPTSRINAIHPSTQILGDLKLAVQTRSKVNKSSRAHAFVNYIQKPRRNNHKDFQHCLFACFLSQIEPKKISEALEDESWVDAMQEELL
ncbi:hypothetical protein Tco_0488284 [Tanacetum coccineum]